MLSRLIYGGRIRCHGLVPVILATLVGGTLGVIAGIRPARQQVIMRAMDVFYAFPSVLLAVAICRRDGRRHRQRPDRAVHGVHSGHVRVAETVTTQVRNLDFVEAARATGARTFTSSCYHVLANVLGPILIYAYQPGQRSSSSPSGLSFLGLGVRPPTADWGLMLNTLRQAIYIAS